MSEVQLEKILIIDDSSDYRKLIKLFINKLLPGIEVAEHDPVEQGVPDENFNWADFDVLLLDFDLSIPGVTGLDILQKYHKKPDFPATIMLTGAGTEEIAVRALKTGIYKYQSKQNLTKDKLKQLIIHAWESKKEERKRVLEMTQQNQAFNKEVFYEKLRIASENPDSQRVLIVIQPDNIQQFEKNIGVIGRDNLIRFIAKKCFEVFKLGDCNPNITRISDTAIALQIDFPDSWYTLEHNMQGLCKHLTKSSFHYADVAHDYKISIGILKLGEFIASPQQLIEIASEAACRAVADKSNSYYIWKDDDTIETAVETSTEEKDNVGQEVEAARKKKQRLETELKQAKAAQAEKARVEAELRAKQEEQQQRENKLKAEAEARAKAQFEAELQAIKETRAQLEEELQAISGAKEKAEAEMRAVQEARAKLEEEIRTASRQVPAPASPQATSEAAATTPQSTSTKPVTVPESTGTKSTTASTPLQGKESVAVTQQASGSETQQMSETQENESEGVDSQQIEASIKQLLSEKRIIQTYQPVISMTEEELEGGSEIYQTGLSSVDGNSDVNQSLKEISSLSADLQQSINQFMLRQIFARITESGIEKTPYRFIIDVTEGWFTDIQLFQWLQKILTQTKQYNPGKAIILNLPLPIYQQHQKRAAALISTLHKTHHIQVALSSIEGIQDVYASCRATSARLLIADMQQLKKLSALLAPAEKEKDEDDAEKMNLLQYLKTKGILVATKGIEDATLLTDAITAGTDYAIGGFVGEIQESLNEASSLEAFELT